MTLKSTTLLCLAMLLLGSANGCNLFRKNKKVKEGPPTAAALETSYRERWIGKRTAELKASGTEPAVATEQAAKEFAEKFPYLAGPGQK